VPKLSESKKYRIETVAIDEFHGPVAYTLQSYFSPVSARIFVDESEFSKEAPNSDGIASMEAGDCARAIRRGIVLIYVGLVKGIKRFNDQAEDDLVPVDKGEGAGGWTFEKIKDVKMLK
jgi:hypothetical protein